MSGNSYLRKYAHLYAIERGPDGAARIKCSRGHISTYSLKKRLLFFYGSWLTARGKNAFLRSKPHFCAVSQEADAEVVVVFPEARLPEMVKPCRVRCRRKYSPKERQRLAFRLGKATAAQEVSQ